MDTANDPDGKRVDAEADRLLAEVAARNQQREAKEAFVRVVEAFERSLGDNGIAEEELARQWQTVETASHDSQIAVDDALFANYAERLDRFAKRKRRRAMFRAAGAFAVALVVFAAIGGGVWYWLHSRQVARAVAELQALFETEQWEAADDYLQQLTTTSRSLAEAPGIRDLERAINAGRRKEQDREALFRQYLAAAQDRGPERPDRAALSEAKKLAKPGSEQAAVQAFESQITAHLEDARQAETAALRKELTIIADALATLERDNPADAPQAASSLYQRLRALDMRASELGLATELDRLLKRVEALQQARDQQRQMQAAETSIADALGDAERFALALSHYATTFPKSPWAASFVSVSKEQTFWQGLEAWSALSESSREFHLRACSLDEAAALAKRIGETATRYPGYPQLATWETLQQCLAAIEQRRNGPDGPPLKALKDKFTDPLIFGLFVVIRRDGRRYYTPKEVPAPRLGMGKVRFSHLVDFDRGRREVDVDQADVIAASDRVLLSNRAPQSVLADQVLRQLSRLEAKPSDWESVFFSLIRQLADPRGLITLSSDAKPPDDVPLDPVLQTFLLKQLLQPACQGSYPLQLSLAKYVTLLKEPSFDLNAKWMDPDDEEAPRARQQAKLLLEQLKDIDAAGKAAAAELNRIATEQRPTYRWVGWLRRDAAGPWSCVGKPAAGLTGPLIVIHAPSGKVEMSPVGQVHDGQFQLSSASAGPAWLVGRPVFLEIKPTGAP